MTTTKPAPAAAEAHSALPWSVGEHPGNAAGSEWRMVLASSPFGEMYVAEALGSDAAFIVRAANHHAKLVALAEQIARMTECGDNTCPDDAMETLNSLIASAQKTLASIGL